MRFALSAEQREFRDAVDALLRNTSGVKASRAWAGGDVTPGLAIWRGLADIGVQGLAVPETFSGSGFHPVELCVAMERIGYHAAPGPYAESLAASVLLADGSLAATWLPQLANGAMATLAIPPYSPYAPNADIADLCLTPGGIAEPGPPTKSLDPTRTLFTLTTSPHDHAEAFNTAALLTAAQLTGLARATLDLTVDYAKQRIQFGHPIGEYQAVKHQLANALVNLEFARPLVYAAALSLSTRDISTAKAATSEAAYQTARTALQLHGAIGYTDEYDLSVWFKRIRALHSAWGSPAFHKQRLMTEIAPEQPRTA